MTMNTGMWTAHDCTFASLGDNTFIVGIHDKDVSDTELHRVLDSARTVLPEGAKILMVRGPLTYESLGESDALKTLIRQLIDGAITHAA